MVTVTAYRYGAPTEHTCPTFAEAVEAAAAIEGDGLAYVTAIQDGARIVSGDELRSLIRDVWRKQDSET